MQKKDDNSSREESLAAEDMGQQHKDTTRANMDATMAVQQQQTVGERPNLAEA